MVGQSGFSQSEITSKLERAFVYDLVVHLSVAYYFNTQFHHYSASTKEQLHIVWQERE
jgi:hypothetical protein